MVEYKPILLIEDEDLDAKAVQRAAKELHVANPLVRVANGEEALHWLGDLSHIKPGLILLDLNLPIMSGLEFLKAAKANPELQTIPVVVLTTSRLEADRLESFKHSVAGYMVKPVDYLQFVDLMRTINVYWTISEGPPPP